VKKILHSERGGKERGWKQKENKRLGGGCLGGMTS